MGKPHFHGRSENLSHFLANQRNGSTDLRTIKKEQKFTYGENNLKILQVPHRDAVCKEIQTLEQFEMAKKPAASHNNPFPTQQIQLIDNIASYQFWMPNLKS